MATDEPGRPGILDLGRGWSIAPYPADFAHRDGSTGALFTCPSCDARLTRGESLLSRAEDEASRAARAAERVHAELCARGDVPCQDWPLCGHRGAEFGDAVE